MLPVRQSTATIQWPQTAGAEGFISDVTAPLVSGAPRELDVTIPCQAIATLPADGGLVFSTIPPGGIDAGRNGLFVNANADVVYVAFRDTVAAVAPRDAVASGACGELHIWADVDAVGADFIGIPGARGELDVDKRPQVAGLFTELPVGLDSGVRARVDIDTRFITSPTALKLAVMVLGTASVLASIIALALLDRTTGRRLRGWDRRRTGWATWLADAGVLSSLLLWHIVGPQSSDDGYNLTIARVSSDAGYVTNYYRYFGASEAPFDWYQSVLAHLASISTAGVWMRLPATLAAIGTWLILSHFVLPRLGARLAHNRIALWTGGAVFLAAWLPFNNGLRPEPLIAFGVLLVWMLVEISVARRILWPTALAIVIAVFSVTLAPQGLIALAPLLVGARAVTRMIAARRPDQGLLAQLAPLGAAAAVLFVVVDFTPTKWAVQFGAFAGLAGALGAVTAFALARVGLHSRRNLALYVTALLFVLAWATSGINGWFYTGNYGVPWFDKQPVILGFPVTTIFLVLAIVGGLLTAWLHFRIDYAGHTEVADTGRNRALASTPLLVVAVIMVVLELGSMVKATVGRYPVYTTGLANLSALRSGLSGTSCAMADHVLVEADTNAGLLEPVPGQRYGRYGPLGGENPVGFTPNGVSDTLEPAEPVAANPGTVNSDGPVDKPNIGVGYAAGTGGGYGPEGINGSRVFLPFGLDPARTPVMGSFDENTVAAKATSSWYQLPPRTPDRPLVSVAAAGAIWYYEEDGSFKYGQSLKLQWGVHRPDGSYEALNEVQPIDIFQQKAWRNLRFPLTTAPPEANVARIVADDPNLSEDQWFAFTPPRVPVLQTAQEYLGSQTPVMMDIATASNFPCQRPFGEHLGVAELPEYRILPNFKQMVVSSNQWQSAEDGGPFLFIQALLRTSTIPTYLRDDWYRDWGSLERYVRVVPADRAPEAAIEEGTQNVYGWSRGGPIRALP
uniref:Arabinosyltransferase A n=1 Tax=Mycolicibacterium neoaurum TaxID=1795 RepID=H9NJ49_MYCNE|nr:arabinosyltransferase A [Mycolicibacterium neoaurum]